MYATNADKTEKQCYVTGINCKAEDAAKVIVEETGGRVTDLFGNDQRYDKSIKGAVISNGKVHDEIIDVIKNMI